MTYFEKSVKTPDEATEFMNVTLAEERQKQGNPALKIFDAFLEAVFEPPLVDEHGVEHEGPVCGHIVKFNVL
jgi:hypothetical protein